MANNLTEEPAHKEEKKYVFKDPTFDNTKTANGKKKLWRSLKQITTQERNLPWPDNTINYSSISAPPSFKPVKKYSDISGLIVRIKMKNKNYFQVVFIIVILFCFRLNIKIHKRLCIMLDTRSSAP